MNHFKKLFIAGFLFTAFSGTLLAKATNNSKTLNKLVNDYSKALSAKNYQKIVDVIPPKMLDAIAKQGKLPVAKLKTLMVEQMKQVFSVATLHSFKLDTKSAKFAKTSTKRAYALVPTNSVISTKQTGKIEIDSHTVALEDGGKWYLARIEDDKTKEILLQSYPDFKTIKIPNAVKKNVK